MAKVRLDEELYDALVVRLHCEWTEYPIQCETNAGYEAEKQS